MVPVHVPVPERHPAGVTVAALLVTVKGNGSWCERLRSLLTPNISVNGEFTFFENSGRDIPSEIFRATRSPCGAEGGG